MTGASHPVSILLAAFPMWQAGNRQVLLILSSKTVSSTLITGGKRGQSLQVDTDGWRACFPGEELAVV